MLRSRSSALLLGGLLLASTARAGTASVSPASAQVQAKATFYYDYVVGAGGLGVGDAIRIVDPEFHGVRWAQWGKDTLDPSKCTPPRTDEDPSDSVISLSYSGAASLSLTRNVNADGGSGGEEGWSEVTVEAGSVAPGETIELVYGDTSLGVDCGHEMPDRSFHHVDWPLYENIGGAGWAELSPAPTIDIDSLDDVALLYVAAPSRVLAGEPFTVRVTPMDRLGNPVERWTGTVALDDSYGGASHTFSLADGGTWATRVAVADPTSVVRVGVSGGGFAGTSNPVEVYPADAPPADFLYWGDIHVHFGHSYDDGTEHVDENVTYGRDVIGLDVVSESMKLDPVCIDGPGLWAELQDNCTSYTSDGDFVDLLSFEWMGNLVGNDNGHNNFYFDNCDVDASAHYDAMLYPDGIDSFGSGQGPFEWAAAQEALGTHTVIIPHSPVYTGYNWGADAHDDHYRRLAEVYSEWGFSVDASDDGSVERALQQGNHMAFLASSDNHVGWMGNPLSAKNVRSGLAAFFAPALTRADVFAAMEGRSTYATTGSRIIVEFAVEDGGSVAPGEEYVAGSPVFTWTVHGTDTIDEVRLMATPIIDGADTATLATWTPKDLDAADSFTWTGYGGDDEAVWLEVTQVADAFTGDDEAAWSSPIWLTTACDHDDAIDPAGRCSPGPDTAPTDSAQDSAATDSPPKDSAGAPPDTAGPRSRRCGCDVGGAPAPAWTAASLGLFLLRRRRRRRSVAAYRTRAMVV